MRKPRFGRSSALSLMFKTIIVRILFNRRHNHIFSFRAYRSNHISLRLMKAVGRTALTGIRAYRKHHTAIRQCRSVSNPCRVCSNHTQERLSIRDVKAGLSRKVREKPQVFFPAQAVRDAVGAEADKTVCTIRVCSLLHSHQKASRASLHHNMVYADISFLACR